MEVEMSKEQKNDLMYLIALLLFVWIVFRKV